MGWVVCCCQETHLFLFSVVAGRLFTKTPKNVSITSFSSCLESICRTSLFPSHDPYAETPLSDYKQKQLQINAAVPVPSSENEKKAIQEIYNQILVNKDVLQIDSKKPICFYFL